MGREFLEGYLALNPETATGLGDHRFDGKWSDCSSQGIERNLAFQRKILAALEPIPVAQLSRENQVDAAILRHHLEGQLWSLTELDELRWNPLVYNPGPALFSLVARDFAPLPTRLESLAQRLESLPEFLKQARKRLTNPPSLHTETAIQQNEGCISFLRQDLEEFLQQAPEMRPRVEKAREVALKALQDYGEWLKTDLLPRSRGDFRLGPEKYRRKLYFALESSLSPEELAERARKDLVETHREMARLARTLCNEPLSDEDLCRKVLHQLAEERPTSETIVGQAQASLERTSQFVREHRLVTLPPEPCRIIEMPEFNRGVAIAYCDSPGPLEKGGETYYAIAPTPKDWSAQRALSFYREYNNYMLEDLTIHEAMPGHYLQLMHANRFQAPTRIRAVMQSGTLVEGWATYAEQLMAEHGYGGPEVRMQQLKMRLRLILNCLLDQGVHLGQMEQDQAVAWLMKEGFQEEGEATGKWRRACLTSAQLSTYYVGNCEVNDLVRGYQQLHPQASLQQLHDHLLSFGSPAPCHIATLLGLPVHPKK